MASSDVNQVGRGYETRRTQAVPKHTLFGTTLETHSREDLERMKHLDPDEPRHKALLAASHRSNYRLPEHLSGSITGLREELDSMQRRLGEQQERVSRTSKRLKSLEQLCKYFKVDEVSRSLDHSSGRPEALRATDPINRMSNGRILGRRYGLHPTMTAPFRLDDPGADRDLHLPAFLDPVTSHGANRTETVSEKALNIDNGPPRSMPHPTYFEHNSFARDKFVRLPSSLANNYGRHLPANIQHRFGTQVCQGLFSDRSLVEQAVPPHRTRRSPRGPGGQEDDRPAPDVDYQSLGHLLRYNLGQAYGRQFDKGVTQTDFDSSVHTRRVPTTDQYRYHKDDLSKWAEQDVIRNRMAKVWDERQTEIKEAKTARA